jgi:hypothetical protein
MFMGLICTVAKFRIKVITSRNYKKNLGMSKLGGFNRQRFSQA